MKQSFVLFLIFIVNNNFCQTKIIDLETQQAISNVHLVSDLGIVIDISDKNGKIDLKKIQDSKFNNITFHHVGYKGTSFIDNLLHEILIEQPI